MNLIHIWIGSTLFHSRIIFCSTLKTFLSIRFSLPDFPSGMNSNAQLLSCTE